MAPPQLDNVGHSRPKVMESCPQRKALPVFEALRTPAVALTTLALALTLATPSSAKTLTSSGDPVTNTAGQTFKVLAHRGGASQWPENSLEAYTGAAEAGYDGIETDILFTADDKAVMSHYDKLPSRCTQAGTRIHTMTLAQVQLVRCEDHSGNMTVPIPTFTDLVGVLKAHPEVWLTLDIKAYSGQSAAGKRAYATWATKLVLQNGLLNRTRLLSFNFDKALPAIRKVAPKAYVLAYDHNGFDYDRVRLADKLGATAYGTEAKYTSVNLAQFVRARGLELVPWSVSTSQGQAMAIYYGPKTFWFMTDSPAAMATRLTSGAAKLNWAASDNVTVLAKPVTVSKGTYQAKRNHYPKVLGNAVPSSKLAALQTVNLAVTVTKGPSKNYLYTAARSSASASTKKRALPKGTATIYVSVPVGDAGKLRIRTSKKTKLTVKVIGYTNQVFTEAPPVDTTGS